VVDNGSNCPRTLALLRELETARNDFSVLRDPSTFNFSALNNAAVRNAHDEEILVFLNDDTEAVVPDWLHELAVNAVRPEIGAVGAKLLYPNGTIQHAGVILGIGGVAGHAFKKLPADHQGQMNRANLIHNISAVTGACMAVENAKFQTVGGFDEDKLAIAFNDVDLCLKLLQAGYRNLYLPQVLLTHHESYSRGLEDTPEKQARFKKEIQVMQSRWGPLLQNDPAYNPNLSRSSEHFDLGKDVQP
jgi:GT2 family glycosyltransferase